MCEDSPRWQAISKVEQSIFVAKNTNIYRLSSWEMQDIHILAKEGTAQLSAEQPPENSSSVQFMSDEIT